MTLQECYEYLEADYDGVMKRLMKEERIIRFLTKLLDEPLYDVLQDALDRKNYEEAFRAAHNMKGVCQNLGINKLAESSSELCETMRHGEPQIDIGPLQKQVKEDYDKTIQAIKELTEG